MGWNYLEIVFTLVERRNHYLRINFFLLKKHYCIGTINAKNKSQLSWRLLGHLRVKNFILQVKNYIFTL